jgi:hypothetical protein
MRVLVGVSYGVGIFGEGIDQIGCGVRVWGVGWVFWVGAVGGKVGFIGWVVFEGFLVII